VTLVCAGDDLLLKILQREDIDPAKMNEFAKYISNKKPRDQLQDPAVEAATRKRKREEHAAKRLDEEVAKKIKALQASKRSSQGDPDGDVDGNGDHDPDGDGDRGDGDDDGDGDGGDGVGDVRSAHSNSNCTDVATVENRNSTAGAMTNSNNRNHRSESVFLAAVNNTSNSSSAHNNDASTSDEQNFLSLLEHSTATMSLSQPHHVGDSSRSDDTRPSPLFTPVDGAARGTMTEALTNIFTNLKRGSSDNSKFRRQEGAHSYLKRKEKILSVIESIVTTCKGIDDELEDESVLVSKLEDQEAVLDEIVFEYLRSRLDNSLFENSQYNNSNLQRFAHSAERDQSFVVDEGGGAVNNTKETVAGINERVAALEGEAGLEERVAPWEGEVLATNSCSAAL
jgi:hypothetical protein